MGSRSARGRQDGRVRYLLRFNSVLPELSAGCWHFEKGLSGASVVCFQSGARITCFQSWTSVMCLLSSQPNTFQQPSNGKDQSKPIQMYNRAVFKLVDKVRQVLCVYSHLNSSLSNEWRRCFNIKPFECITRRLSD